MIAVSRRSFLAILPIWILLIGGQEIRGDERALQAEQAKSFFRQNCMSCHTIGGGRLTGPDLKGALERKDRSWLKRFLLDPVAMLESGDAYAAKLKKESRGAVMPRAAGITPQVADLLIDLIEAESELEKSEFAGLQISERPLTAIDVERGREIFLGLHSLERQGASCISCHSINGIGGLGGGLLGPDLTKVYDRLQGRKGLATWLAAPATPTMQSIFKPHPLESGEILALVAYFKEAAETGSEAPPSGPLHFILLGLVGAVGVLVIFDVLWRTRFRSVRARLVADQGERALHR
ncbi:MAG: c-type cytochrome [Planctomycetota bacterium]|jgi:mono/diheme cytochrome c family protein|nr:c-type cytochrome [Planctomycetota bacterium]